MLFFFFVKVRIKAGQRRGEERKWRRRRRRVGVDFVTIRHLEPPPPPTSRDDVVCNRERHKMESQLAPHQCESKGQGRRRECFRLD